MVEEQMAFVAEDPQQPGAAWAIAADNPATKDHNDKEIASWLRAGAIVRRVPSAEAKEMFLRWKRPSTVGEQMTIEV